MLLECRIRKERVAATPEEIVRQQLIAYMVDTLGYPKGQIAVEKELRLLPHLRGKKVPDRRADLIVFAPDIHPQFPLYPLLLIECKAVKLTPKVIQQVVGYNAFVRAYFVAVANGEAVQTGWLQKKEYTFVDTLPSYRELLAHIC